MTALGRIYVRDEKLVVAFNDAGVMKYRYLDMRDGADYVWREGGEEVEEEIKFTSDSNAVEIFRNETGRTT